MLFFAIAFGWSWTVWGTAIVLDGGFDSARGYALLLLGLFGPATAAIFCARIAFTQQEWRDYWTRLADPRRIAPRWWLVAVFFTPILIATALLIGLAGGTPDSLRPLGSGVGLFVDTPAALAPFLIRVLLQGPLPEELGWRGYALPRLQARFSPARASLILGAIWGLWHLPLFYSSHYGHAAWSPWFWHFECQVLATSVVMTWLFNNTRSSTLAAIVFHFTANLA